MITSEAFQVCEEALEDVFAWLSAGGEVAVFDATNTTRLAFLIHRLGLIGYWGLLVALTRLNHLNHSENERPKSGWRKSYKISNRQRRELLHSRVVTERGYKLFFVESICEDQSIIEANIRSVCLSFISSICETIMETIHQGSQGHQP